MEKVISDSLGASSEELPESSPSAIYNLLMESLDPKAMLKDLKLSQQAAKLADADTPIGAKATELYRQFVEDENSGDQDFSAMLKRFEKRKHSH